SLVINSLGTVDDKTQDRRQGNATPSGDGEDHQAKSTEEYSTEYGCRSGRGCLLTHKVHPPSLQDVQQYKVRQEQDHEDFAAVQAEEAEGESDPGHGAAGQSGKKAAGRGRGGGGPEASFYHADV